MHIITLRVNGKSIDAKLNVYFFD